MESIEFYSPDPYHPNASERVRFRSRLLRASQKCRLIALRALRLGWLVITRFKHVGLEAALSWRTRLRMDCISERIKPPKPRSLSMR